MSGTESGASAAQVNDAALDKGYEPQAVEARWAAEWEKRGLFHAPDTSDKPPYAIVLPPPNVTGSLHIGHALTATLEDVLIRWKRMSGFNACWLPGIDHAGIATQMVVERELLKTEKKSRHDLGREEFLKRVWEWKEKSGGRIAQQHRALGASLDWERERFTMDAHSSRAVREAFVRLWEDGLLYRAERLINWCTRCRTALSDLEVEHEEGFKSELYKFAYPLAEALSGSELTEIVVATTRVETMLGDTAIAVHPDDPRYQAVIGKNVRHPITGRLFPIIADAELVDMKFGTGAVKVTPAHSPEDFESGKRHGLPMLNILNLDGTLNEVAGPFAGQDRIKVRPALKARLLELGLERGSEPHVMALGKCQRCDSVVEPLLSLQWFVKTRPLADKAVAAAESGKLTFQPEQWQAEFYRWMKDIRDWCVSRQLWWGHQIPAWYCENKHITVARENPSACAECGSKSLKQDEDVLDTWFSSGLWPFSTFGWPDKTPALATFYPNAVLETGFDILFFWVARMAMMGLHFMGDVPFRTVFLHAMVRDEKGEKMSKTRGNVIDPLDITSKYGADALRFTLASLAAQGRDIKLAVDRIQANKAFANKIWNAARFVMMHADAYDANAPAAPATVYDRWILSRLHVCAEATNKALNEYRFSDAALGVYRFVWGDLCDWAIELSKPALLPPRDAAGEPLPYPEEQKQFRAASVSTLLRALDGALRLLHPFMPFVTEEIWQKLPRKQGAPASIMTQPYPGSTQEPLGSLFDAAAVSEMDVVSRAIDGARSVRGEVALPPNQRVPIVLLARDPQILSLLDKHSRAFQQLALASQVTLLGPDAKRPAQAAVHVEPEVEVHLPLAGLIDFAEEAKRVEKELQKLEGELAGLEKRLGNEGFVARAPRDVVEKDRARADELRGKKDKLARHLARISSTEEAK
jgi:valyl-tRNA synthetase